MFLLDANVLVYAVDATSPQHARALQWLDANLDGRPQTAGLPWPTLLAFLRLVTNPRVYSEPATAMQAWGQIQDWLDRPAAWIPVPGPGHRNILAKIMGDVGPVANLVPDAHLAALALEHGLTVVSTDSDFARFSSISWLNPLR